MRGRKPIPPELKNNGPAGDSPSPAGPVPTCPAWYDPDARELWERLGPLLHAKGLLSDTNAEAFGGYCQTYAQWKQAVEIYRRDGMVITTGRGMTRIHPMVTHAAEMARQFRAYAAEFGLTPASRARAGNPTDNSAGDILDQFSQNIRPQPLPDAPI